ncbi:transposable element Tcb1 transposase [Trichonephila clavipes]|nr:transposable element Tcb1 transposase [Trichonephila clavipes]
MDDNATCHRTLAVQDCLDSEGIQRLVWPVRSPDLNPIVNVWDALGRQVAGRNYPPTNKNTLIRALTEEWDKLPQQLLDNVVRSMVRRVECCITLHSGHIPTQAKLSVQRQFDLKLKRQYVEARAATRWCSHKIALTLGRFAVSGKAWLPKCSPLGRKKARRVENHSSGIVFIT